MPRSGPSACTTPVVSAPIKPNGFPTASTNSPGRKALESPGWQLREDRARKFAEMPNRAGSLAPSIRLRTHGHPKAPPAPIGTRHVGVGNNHTIRGPDDSRATARARPARPTLAPSSAATVPLPLRNRGQPCLGPPSRTLSNGDGLLHGLPRHAPWKPSEACPRSHPREIPERRP